MQAFLQAQAPNIAAQVNAARAKFLKADLSPEELAAIEAILASLQFSDWTVLVGDVEPLMMEIIKSQGLAALAQVGIDVEARPEVLKIVNEYAVNYAQNRAAELVGMRYNELGVLVENPNAEWAISESTREMIRGQVTQAIDEGWSNQKLASEIQDAYAFSPERANMIARTETSIAVKEGAMEGYRASGVVEGKEWLTAEDDLVEEDCQENADQGIIALDDEFANGDNPHPNCRCAIAPVTDLDSTDEG